jgi:hypothetical protein
MSLTNTKALSFKGKESSLLHYNSVKFHQARGYLLENLSVKF